MIFSKTNKPMYGSNEIQDFYSIIELYKKLHPDTKLTDSEIIEEVNNQNAKVF